MESCKASPAEIHRHGNILSRFTFLAFSLHIGLVKKSGPVAQPQIRFEEHEVAIIKPDLYRSMPQVRKSFLRYLNSILTFPVHLHDRPCARICIARLVR